MDLYIACLLGLVLANAGLAYGSHRSKRTRSTGNGNIELSDLQDSLSDVRKLSSGSKEGPAGLKYRFLPVYALVMASDWLQGPYLYPLYKQTLQLPENVVAFLFSTGFISGAISATFVGSLADKYGRKKACLAFCVIYSLSCILTLSKDIPSLFIGRVLGGIGTTLLFTVFEAWLVAEFHQRKLAKEGESELSALLGTMTVLNSIVAVLSGLSTNFVVSYTDTRRAPFVVSVVCLILAFLAISRKWGENYNTDGHASDNTERVSVFTVLRDKRILGLMIVSTIFEGTMYLFVVFWSPAMISARQKSGTSGDPPFGIIFASFMAAMMLGSQISSQLMPSSSSTSTASPLSPDDSRSISLSRSSHLLSLLLPISSGSLSWSVIRPTELGCLLAFCVFESGIGVYYPNMGVVKSLLVDDKIRASVYALLRVPLNCFVFAGLALTKEGEEYRNNVFMTCAALLLGAMLVHSVLISGAVKR